MSLSSIHVALRAEIRGAADNQDLRQLSSGERRALRAMQRRMRAAAVKGTGSAAPKALPTGMWF